MSPSAREHASQHGLPGGAPSSELAVHGLPGFTPSSGPGATIWFTGLSGAGKSTLAESLAELLDEDGIDTTNLDGDDIRTGLNADLGFSFEDRVENIRRVGEVARLFALAGHLVVVSFISPYRDGRRLVRARHEESRLPFALVHVATPIEECERRDPKGLYARARRGEIGQFTGVSDPYEPPLDADIVIDTVDPTPSESAGELLAALRALPNMKSLLML